jgi:hypothetical protein
MWKTGLRQVLQQKTLEQALRAETALRKDKILGALLGLSTGLVGVAIVAWIDSRRKKQ